MSSVRVRSGGVGYGHEEDFDELDGVEVEADARRGLGVWALGGAEVSYEECSVLAGSVV